MLAQGVDVCDVLCLLDHSPPFLAGAGFLNKLQAHSLGKDSWLGSAYVPISSAGTVDMYHHIQVFVWVLGIRVQAPMLG